MKREEIKFDHLVSFIREEIGEYNMDINKETLIENDLGVTGDEAIALMKSFANTFNVAISDFNYSKYFYPEPSIFNTYSSIQPLTVGALYVSLKEGKLV